MNKYATATESKQNHSRAEVFSCLSQMQGATRKTEHDFLNVTHKSLSHVRQSSFNQVSHYPTHVLTVLIRQKPQGIPSLYVLLPSCQQT